MNLNFAVNLVSLDNISVTFADEVQAEVQGVYQGRQWGSPTCLQNAVAAALRCGAAPLVIGG